MQEQKKKHLVNEKKHDHDDNQRDLEDQEAQPIQSKVVKKDMKSLFEDSDDESEAKKVADEKARLERHKKIIKNITEEGSS